MNIAELKERVSMEEIILNLGGAVQTSWAGGNLKAWCPIHGDRHPSATIYPDDVFHCFGCGVRGDVLDVLIAAGQAADTRGAMGWLEQYIEMRDSGSGTTTS